MKYVNESIVREFAEKGKLIGKSTPCQETKWGWWEVRSLNERTVAICMDPQAGICCGEEITLDELNLYVD